MKILLALGANLPSVWGKPAETLSHAIGDISERIGSVAISSRFFATPAYPDGSGPDFVNAVVGLEADLSPGQLLEMCHVVETKARRVRDSRWEPRTLDIDVLACDDLVLPTAAVQAHWRTLPMGEQATTTPDELILPHPRLQDRAFVLVPMMDIAPDWRHPLTGQSTEQMLAALPEADKRAIRPLKGP